MPFIELLLYLKEQGDRIVGGEGDIDAPPSTFPVPHRLTEKGERYVRSNEGLRYQPRYIWIRV
ncbi:MAG: hypothetical protein QUS11_11265 [Candidatus Fermentibacter sp.]|nr:hypothetical protein [Candidatus Fermentibacter sp.]